MPLVVSIILIPTRFACTSRDVGQEESDEDKYYPDGPACAVICLPNEIRSLFHRGEAYFAGIYSI